MKCILGVAVLLFISVLIEEHEAVPPKPQGERGDSGGRRVQRSISNERMFPSDGHNAEIPISFHDTTSHTEDLFQAAIEPFRYFTCISFIEHSNKPDYLKIDSNGCSSLIGRRGGAQRLSLNCESKGEVQRELLHSLGFSYETQRPDRDKYIKIHWENIQEDKVKIFKQLDRLTLNRGPYNYRSVMHFPSTAFSANGEPTLEAVGDSEVQLGSEEMTEEDIKRVNQLYCSRMLLSHH